MIELAGIGPGPFAAMMLADLGADVVRVDRTTPAGFGSPPGDLLNRNRRSLAVDLKSAAGREVVLALTARADALLEGFRPGVTERSGSAPPTASRSTPGWSTAG